MILFLFNIIDILEMITGEKILPLLSNTFQQHGYRSNHSMTTALEKLIALFAACFNEKWPKGISVAVVLDTSALFDTVNLTGLLEKILEATK